MAAEQGSLAGFLAAVAVVLGCDAAVPADRRAAAEQIVRAMAGPGQPDRSHRPSTLATCRHLNAALDAARRARPPIAAVAEAFSDLAPMLAWRHRAGSRRVGRSFHDGHANTTILGPDGMYRSDQVKVGATLLQPGVCYPGHRHPPREFYLVMSEGDWFNENDGWYTPGVGAIVYHPSGIEHAMRAGDAPLLAVWCLGRDPSG